MLILDSTNYLFFFQINNTSLLIFNLLFLQNKCFPDFSTKVCFQDSGKKKKNWYTYTNYVYWLKLKQRTGFPGEASGKNLPVSIGDVKNMGSILRSRRSLRGGHGNPLQYACLENPMDGRAWWVTVHRFTRSWT